MLTPAVQRNVVKEFLCNKMEITHFKSLRTIGKAKGITVLELELNSRQNFAKLQIEIGGDYRFLFSFLAKSYFKNMSKAPRKKPSTGLQRTARIDRCICCVVRECCPAPCHPHTGRYALKEVQKASASRVLSDI
jgi:hypothetical protein